MDSLRGQDDIDSEDSLDYGAIEPPPAIDTQERRMHVRAYNCWVSLLGNRCLPSIEDLNPEDMEDFSPNSVLLDFSLGLENPAVLYLGSALREECGITGSIERINEVPPRSLLTRLTDHYLQIIANAAPVGFEAEFTNQRDIGILYRGILMPFSSDDETIDFIYGVINWKEVASDSMVEQLGEEMKAAMNQDVPSYPTAPIWADGPSATTDFEDEDQGRADHGTALDDGDFGFDEIGSDAQDDPDGSSDVANSEIQDYPTETAVPADLTEAAESVDELDLSAFLAADEDDAIANAFAEFEAGRNIDSTADAPVAELANQPEVTAPAVANTGLKGDRDDAQSDGVDNDFVDDELHNVDDQVQHVLSRLVSATEVGEPIDSLDALDAGDDLALALDMARQSAVEAKECDARSRVALYRAISHAHDFVLSAQSMPEEYAAMLEQAGIVAQERSPMTAVVKLVFGAEYDKTRIAEYALALDYAQTHNLPRGSFADHLGTYSGGLKGLVQDMRFARKPGEPGAPTGSVRHLDRAVRKLNRASPVDADALPFGELGLAVVIARREADGSISLVAGVGLEDKAAQKIMIAASKSV